MKKTTEIGWINPLPTSKGEESKTNNSFELYLRLGRILDETSNEIYLFDSCNFKLIQTNLGACRNLGYSRDEMSLMTFPDVAPELTLEIFESLTLPLQTREMNRVSHETVFRRKNGSNYSVELWLHLSNAEQAPIFVAMAEDISDRVKVMKKLKYFADELHRSNALLQSFAGIASNSLREPLRKIIAFGERLQKKYADILDEEGTDYIERMSKSAKRMQHLIDNLLQYSQITDKLNPFFRADVKTVIENVLCDLEARFSFSRKRIRLGHLPVIEVDEFQARQLFFNLISNALKFRKPDETPLVEIDSRYLGNGFWEILVADNGIGFDEKYLDRIFMPFERLNGRSEYEGSGMGLAICKKIVTSHGGTITAKSVWGKGSTFIISLPQEQIKNEDKTLQIHTSTHEAPDWVVTPILKNPATTTTFS